jgi:hypothetical protein
LIWEACDAARTQAARNKRNPGRKFHEIGHRYMLHNHARHLPGGGSGNSSAAGGGLFDDEL